MVGRSSAEPIVANGAGVNILLFYAASAHNAPNEINRFARMPDGLQVFIFFYKNRLTNVRNSVNGCFRKGVILFEIFNECFQNLFILRTVR